MAKVMALATSFMSQLGSFMPHRVVLFVLQPILITWGEQWLLLLTRSSLYQLVLRLTFHLKAWLT